MSLSPDATLRALTGQPVRRTSTRYDGVYDAVVVRSDADGVFVRLDVLSGGATPPVHGPCRYSPPPVADPAGDGHTHGIVGGLPPVNTVCLVAFAQGDTRSPWIVAFSGWPS